MKHKFRVSFKSTVEAVVELDEAVITAVDAEWRAKFDPYIWTPLDVAKHVGRHLVAGLRLSQLAGWENQPDENASVKVTYSDNQESVLFGLSQTDAIKMLVREKAR